MLSIPGPPGSIHLGTLYSQLRAVPSGHIIRVTVDARETSSRNKYDELIAKPVRRAINDLYANGEKIRCLVTTFGIPLRVNAVKPPILPENEIEKYSRILREKQGEMEELRKQRHETNGLNLKAEIDIRQLNKQIETLFL